ncbi:MAG TPA: hypothetical protein VE868_00960 [Balneolaceae bacterium]|nr:hypothetical protein [Balneolaceae bacterium]
MIRFTPINGAFQSDSVLGRFITFMTPSSMILSMDHIMEALVGITVIRTIRATIIMDITDTITAITNNDDMEEEAGMKIPESVFTRDRERLHVTGPSAVEMPELTAVRFGRIREIRAVIINNRDREEPAELDYIPEIAAAVATLSIRDGRATIL